MSTPSISVVTPVHNEAENLLDVHGRLARVLEDAGLDWDWIVVDDHSDDGTFALLVRLVSSDPRVKVRRLSRRFGSHNAITCGLDESTGDVTVIMAGDLQDAPEDIPRLIAAWQTGAQVVWGTRAPGQRSRTSRRFERVVRRLVGPDPVAPSGADFVLVDRVVVQAVRNGAETRVPIFMLLAWIGFRQAHVECTKAPRIRGRSGWSTTAKLELALDSVIAFTQRPLRWIAGLGLLTASIGLLYAVVVIMSAALGDPPEGWSSLMVVTLLLGGIQMLMLGIIGAYLGRVLDEARGRPRYVVEASIPDPSPGCG